MTTAKEKKITVYELFLRQPDGSYQRFIRWDEQEEWIPSGDCSTPYRMLHYTGGTE
ncbi:hypothetical protein LCGC14_2486420 [marine sediment metagenome]|uniref:Uncharacterized protein n=1 Tax=marine sediment metagenome TaxID=412755 RepID=A0A0F9B601_9ZZZZ